MILHSGEKFNVKGKCGILNNHSMLDTCNTIYLISFICGQLHFLALHRDIFKQDSIVVTIIIFPEAIFDKTQCTVKTSC